MKILVTRFSAFGDIVMVAPVLQKILNENNWITITFLTRPQWVPIFDTIERLETIGIDLKKEYNSPLKLINFCYQLHREKKFDFYIDLHSVLRTWIMRGVFKLAGLKSGGISKKRAEKLKYIKNNGKMPPLIHQTERYLNTFREACITLENNICHPILDENIINQGTILIENLLKSQNKNKKKIKIGFAPFATYKQKMWPIELQLEWLELIQKQNIDVNILFFGGGQEEKEKADQLLQKIDNLGVNTINVWSFENEIKAVAALDLMIGMDSGNVHLASVFGVETLTIWGGTDPDLGFSATFQSSEGHINSTDSSLDCRPCSVFGHKHCHRGDWKCLYTISPKQVLDKMKNWISSRI